jgi:CysZ protein
MSRPSGFFDGAAYASRGLGLIFRPGLRRFVWVPLGVNVLVFSMLIWLGLSEFGGLLDRLLPHTGWLAYLRWAIWPLFTLTLALAVFYSFTLVANLIAAPFNSILAERVEYLLTGRAPPGGFEPFWRQILPTLRSELRKASYMLVRALPLLLLFVVPGLNLLAPFLWALLGAWFLAIEYGDYPMANHGLSFVEQHRRLKAARPAALGFGLGVSLLMLVPGLSFLAMPAAVAGATAWWCDSLGLPTASGPSPGR